MRREGSIMKPIYSPAEVQFLRMRPQPEAGSEYLGPMTATDAFPKCVRGKEGALFRLRKEVWVDNKPTARWVKAPYRPGEKCYLKEGWAITGRPDPYADTVYGVQYKSDCKILYPDYPIESHFDVAEWAASDKWRSPVTMPQWAARRFFKVVSCTPMRIGEVTIADIQAAGYSASMMQDPCDMADELRNKFKEEWQSKHPGTWPGQWVWKRVIKEDLF